MGLNAIVVFASREPLLLLVRTLQAVAVAAHGLARIEVLVNGNPALAQSLVEALGGGILSAQNQPVRVWSIAMGDKANAWNQYIHTLWAGEDLAFFVDGYVRPKPDAIHLLAQGMRARPEALAGTGVPSMGRSAAVLRKDLIEEGGLHGNLCCIRGSVIAQFRASGIALPLGHYRTDSLMASILYFGLDPGTQGWEWHRIFAHAQATWETDPRHWWRPGDVADSLKRRLRQARGLLENRAVQEHLDTRRQPPQTLLANSSDLVLDWVRRCPSQVQAELRGHPLERYALRKILRAPQPPDGDPKPALAWRADAPGA